jgi:eukaryotic-like serine/threonine-protein kinase
MSQRFLEMIEKSGLLTKEQVDPFLEQLRKDVPADVLENEQALAEKFVAAGLLTPWQTEKLVQGKHKGFLLGNYKLLRHLGAGGMSTVFLAEHKHMRQRRAIKVLPQNRVNDSSYLGRFYREARAAAALDHPNIVRAYDVDNDGDNHYLVMEYVEGTDMQKLVAMQGVLPFETAAEYVRQAAFGLAHAHIVGLIHRDIKPANLLVDPKGTVKILDMGLARFADDEKQASLTQMHDENVLGTADYLAPEQAINSHTVDARADLYSLGCTLYFALTGHPPFPEGTLAQRLLMHQQREPAPIAKDRPDVPKDLVGICKRMMAKSVDERFQNAEDVEQALGRWLSDRGGGARTAFQPGGIRGGGGGGGGGQPAGGRQGGVQTAQRAVPKAKPADDSNNRLAGVGDTLTGSGQPTTKGPAGKHDSGDSSSKLGGKKGVAARAGDSGASPIIGPPPAATNKKPGDSSGSFNFNIKTDDSNVLSNRSGKKPVAKAVGDSDSSSGSSSGSGPKNTAPAKGTAAKGPVAKGTAANAAVAKKTVPPGKNAAAESAKQAAADGSEPPKLKKLKKKTKASTVIIGALVMVFVCIGLVFGLMQILERNKRMQEENIQKAMEEEAAAAKKKQQLQQQQMLESAGGAAPAAPAAPTAQPEPTGPVIKTPVVPVAPTIPAPTTGT